MFLEQKFVLSISFIFSMPGEQLCKGCFEVGFENENVVTEKLDEKYGYFHDLLIPIVQAKASYLHSK